VLAQQKIDNSRNTLKMDEGALKTKTQKYQAQWHELSKKISEFSLSPDQEYQELCRSLTQKNQDYLSNQKHVDELEGKIKESKTNLSHLTDLYKKQQTKLSELKTRATTLETELNELKTTRKNLFGDKSVEATRNSLKERQETLLEVSQQEKERLSDLKIKHKEAETNIKNSKTALTEIKSKLEKAQKTYQNALKSSPFEDEISFQNALMTEEAYSTLKKEKERIDKEKTTTEIKLTQSRDELSQIRKKCLTTKSLEDIVEENQQLEDELSKTQQAITESQITLKNDKKAREEQASLIETIERCEKDWHLWAELNALIGSANGDKFSKFAQGITMNVLIQFANHHLTTLYPRYQLIGADKLMISVIDTYQADIKRPVETLSGGESFLISLALALGLSDLASNKINVESLFLDEGFGTLDSETLDLAIDTLDSLNSTGKMIGIISHVEALKERIPTQINVSSSGGVSALAPEYRLTKSS
jgi:exonuclease SbcC